MTAAPTPATGTFTAKAALSVDGGASSIEVSDFSATAVGVRDANNGSTVHIDVTGLARIGTDEIEHDGTFDAFTLLISLRDIMQNSNNVSDETVRQRASALLSEIDSAHDSVLDGLSELGFRSASMQALDNRVSGLRVSREKSLSDIQDTDMAQAILALQRQDIAYQAALQMGSRVIQTSLQNFL